MRRHELGRARQRRLLREGSKALGQVQPNAADRRTAVLALQRSIGNRNVGRLLQGNLAVQHKLQVGPAGDRYEREADRVADEVVRQMPATSASTGPVLDDDDRVSRLLRRAPTPTATIGLEGGPLDAELERQVGSARSGGHSLPAAMRGRMEGALGADLGGVRVHAGNEADALNQSMQSRAFTVGSDIFFARGQYRPGSPSGQHLLAHELTHTLQQGEDAHRAAWVQRAVGFEFESEDARPAELTRALTGQEQNARPRTRAVPLTDVRWFKKKDVIAPGQGFELQADEDNNNKDSLGRTMASIEFVTKPFAETKAGAKELKKAAKGINQMGTKIGKLPDCSGGRSWLWPEELRSLRMGGRTVMKSPGHRVRVKMQASAGFSLSALPTLMEQLGADPNLAPNAMPNANDVARNQLLPQTKFLRQSKIMAEAPAPARQAADNAAERNDWDDASALAGLLSFFVATVRLCRETTGQGTPYAKALFPLMHRTDFAGMFMQLPTTQKLGLRGDGDCAEWLACVTDALGGMDLSQQVLGTAPDKWNVDLTIEDWATDIAKGRDRFTQAYQAWYVKQETDDDSDEREEGLENAEYTEGVGSLGPRTDELPGGGRGIVMEIRTIQKSMTDAYFPLPDALKLAVKLHTWITKVNQGLDVDI